MTNKTLKLLTSNLNSVSFFSLNCLVQTLLINCHWISVAKIMYPATKPHSALSSFSLLKGAAVVFVCSDCILCVYYTFLVPCCTASHTVYILVKVARKLVLLSYLARDILLVEQTSLSINQKPEDILDKLHLIVKAERNYKNTSCLRKKKYLLCMTFAFLNLPLPFTDFTRLYLVCNICEQSSYAALDNVPAVGNKSGTQSNIIFVLKCKKFGTLFRNWLHPTFHSEVYHIK